MSKNQIEGNVERSNEGWTFFTFAGPVGIVIIGFGTN